MSEESYDLAYQVIASHDNVKYLVLKSELKKYIKSFYKNVKEEYLLAISLKLYYFTINNPVYKEVNNNNINFLKTELHALSCLNNYFKDKNEIYNSIILTTIVDLISLINNINDIRLNYVKGNTNKGRKQASTYQIHEIEELSEVVYELQKTLN
jgi:hypothetical protein